MALRALALPCLLAACTGDEPRSSGGLSVAEALGGADVEGYARAIEPRTFRFPDDHGPHPDFRSEWWYFTGNLDSNDGRRFGYHVTFFRTATRPDEPAAGGSAWRTRQLWMAHFALVDVAAATVHAAERFERGAVGLAGAEPARLSVHVGDWSARSIGEDFAPIRLRAQEAGTELDLELVPDKAPVLQGEDGLSRKSRTPGNASYYYSITRMAVRGSVRVGTVESDVAGTGWFDREWSTSALDEGQVGWDWFALQLDDGRDLMFYRMRLEDGSSDPTSSGVLVAADGSATRLARADVDLVVTSTWTSPRTAATYPAGFRVTVPARGLSLVVRPVLVDQELDLAFRYWEGAVDVSGTADGAPIAGRGYVEMTGYADRREGD